MIKTSFPFVFLTFTVRISPWVAVLASIASMVREWLCWPLKKNLILKIRLISGVVFNATSRFKMTVYTCISCVRFFFNAPPNTMNYSRTHFYGFLKEKQSKTCFDHKNAKSTPIELKFCSVTRIGQLFHAVVVVGSDSEVLVYKVQSTKYKTFFLKRFRYTV